MRGETQGVATSFGALLDFNPLTPCGVRPKRSRAAIQHHDFNPLTPCGVRQLAVLDGIRQIQFQSTHPMRGETAGYFVDYRDVGISIHSPHAG